MFSKSTIRDSSSNLHIDMNLTPRSQPDNHVRKSADMPIRPKTSYSILDEKLQKTKATLNTHPPYQDPIEYSCRSPAFEKDPKVLAKSDFVRRLPVESTNDFKQVYSRENGSLGRPNLVGTPEERFPTLRSPISKRVSSPSVDRKMMKRKSSTGHLERTWSLFVGSPSSYQSLRSPTCDSMILTNDDTTYCPWKEQASIGKRVDFRNEKLLAQITRDHCISPKPKPRYSLRHQPKSYSHLIRSQENPCVFLFDPCEINLETIEINDVYRIPIKVRNVSKYRDRFKVLGIKASSGDTPARKAKMNYNIVDTALAPGLCAIVTAEVAFVKEGEVIGSCRIGTRNGEVDIPIYGSVCQSLPAA